MVTSATDASTRIGTPPGSGTTRVTRSRVSAVTAPTDTHDAIAASSGQAGRTARIIIFFAAMRGGSAGTRRAAAESRSCRVRTRTAAHAAAAALLLFAFQTEPSDAQTLPSRPLVFADGHVTIGGDVSASYGSDDGSKERPGFFNFTDYEHSALRTLRIDVSGMVKGGDRVTVVGEMRTENFDRPEAYALYLRVRPWPARNFDVQAGRIPPTFGAFARRTYPTDNPLIGYPLAYQSLTSLRPDALRASAAELLSKRGLGWLDQFSIPAGT